MASVNFEKIKSISEIKAKIRHCDREERLKHEHSNKQINKNLTHKNIDLFANDNYENACNRLDNRIAYLDSTTNTNKRKDRVNCFGLSIPIPLGLTEEQERQFYVNTYQIICNQYGEDNIIAGYAHYDEIHDYVDASTGNIETSRPHFHLYVVPEQNGILNGKWFSSKANMNKLNKSIDNMCQEDFNISFMTGSKKKGQSVEDLKRRSIDELSNYWEALKGLENDLKAREETLRQQQLNIQALEEEALKKHSEASEKLSECDTLLEDIKNTKINTSFEKWASKKPGLGRLVKSPDGKNTFEPVNILQEYNSDKARVISKKSANINYRKQKLFDIADAYDNSRRYDDDFSY